MCCQSSFVLVLLSGIEHKPQDEGFDVGEPGNGADRSVGYLWSMVEDNLGAVNLEGAVRVTEVTQSEEACTIVVYRATLGPNQSERSKICLDQSASRISPM